MMDNTHNPIVCLGEFLDTFIESVHFPADLKTTQNGRYIQANHYSAEAAGLTPAAFVGMHLTDLSKQVPLKQSFINQVTHIDQVVITQSAKKTFTQSFLDYYDKLRLERVVKIPIISHHNSTHTLAVLSYTQDITPFTDLAVLFKLYQHYYSRRTAIDRFLKYLKINHLFYTLPTRQEMSVLLSMRKHSASKRIAQDLNNINARNVDKYKACLRDKIHTLNLEEIIGCIRLRNEGIPELDIINHTLFT